MDTFDQLYEQMQQAKPEVTTFDQLYNTMQTEKPPGLSNMSQEQSENDYVLPYFREVTEDKMIEANKIKAYADEMQVSPSYILRHQLHKIPFSEPNLKEAVDDRIARTTDKLQSTYKRQRAAASLSKALLAGDMKTYSEVMHAYEEASKAGEETGEYKDKGEMLGFSLAEIASSFGAGFAGAGTAAKFGAAVVAAGSIAAAITGNPILFAQTLKTMGFFVKVGALKEMGHIIHGESANQLIQEGMDKDTANITGIIIAIPSVALEAVGLNRILKNLPGTKALVGKGLNRATKTLMKKAMTFTKEWLAVAGTETATEVVETFLEDIVSNYSKEIYNELRGTNLPLATQDQIFNNIKKTIQAVLPGMLVVGGAAGVSRVRYGDSPHTINRKVDEANTKSIIDRLKSAKEQVYSAIHLPKLKDRQGANVDVESAIPAENDERVVDDGGNQQPTIPITPEEQAAQGSGVDASMLPNEDIQEILEASEEDIDKLVDKHLDQASKSGTAYGDFISGIRSILPKQQSASIEALIKARARATGRTKQEFVKQHKLRFKLEDEGEGKLASTEFIKDGETIIRAFNKTTVAAMVDEIAHVFRHDLSRSELKFAEKTFEVENGEWDEYHEEMFSTRFAQYLATGKAPTKQLAHLFTKFKAWLKEIYRSFKNLGMPLSREMEGLFSGMIIPARDAQYKVAESIAQEETKKLYSREYLKETPWKMTLSEAEAAGVGPKVHRQLVRQAIISGKKVPRRVAMELNLATMADQMKYRKANKAVKVKTALKQSLKNQILIARKAYVDGDKVGVKKATDRYKAMIGRVRNKVAVDRSRHHIRQQIIKKVKQLRAKTVGGKPVGKLTPEVHKIGEQLYPIIGMKQKEAQAEYDKIVTNPEVTNFTLEDVIKTNLLKMIGDFQGMDIEQMKYLYQDLKALITEGQVQHNENTMFLVDKVKNAVSYMSQSMKHIQRLRGDNPNITEWRRKSDEFFKKLNGRLYEMYYDFHGLMAILEEGLSPLMGEGITSKMFETMDLQSKEQEGIDSYHNAVLLDFAKVFNLKNKKGEYDAGLARNKSFEGENEKATHVTTVQLTNTEGTLVFPAKYRKLIVNTAEARLLVAQLRQPDIREVWESKGWTPTNDRELLAKLSPEDMIWVDKIIDFFREYFDSINEVYKKNYHVSLNYIENYVPVSSEIVESKNLGGINDVLGELQPPRRDSATSVHFINRVKSTLFTRPQNDMQVIAHYITEMEHFKAYSELTLMLRSVFINKEFRALIEDTYGKTMMRTIDFHINNMARNGVVDQELSGFQKLLNKVRASLTFGMVSAKPLAIPKQYTSVLSYMAKMPVHTFFINQALFFKDLKRNMKFMNDNSDFVRFRGLTNLDRDIAMIEKDPTYLKYLAKGIPPSYRHSLMFFVKFGDKFAIQAGGWAYYKHLVENEKGKLNHEEAMRKTDLHSTNSQQNAALSRQTRMQQGDPFMRLFTMFTNAQRQYNQMSLLAYHDMKLGKITKRQFMKTVFIHNVMLPMTFQLAVQGGAEDLEDYLNLIGACFVNAFIPIPLIGSATYPLIHTMLGHYNMGAESTAIAPILQTGKGIHGLGRDLFDPDEITAEDVFKHIRNMSAILQYAGLPGPAMVGAAEGFIEGLQGRLVKGGMQILGYSPYTAKKRTSDEE